MTNGLRFTDDPTEIDGELVHRWLSELAYSAAGCTREAHDRAMAASRNYAVRDAATGQQLGYARVVTDGVTFAWLADVFVDHAARGRGVGKALVEGVLADLDPLGLKRIVLRTSDAHGLYEPFGFTSLADADADAAPAGMWMQRIPQA